MPYDTGPHPDLARRVEVLERRAERAQVLALVALALSVALLATGWVSPARDPGTLRVHGLALADSADAIEREHVMGAPTATAGRLQLRGALGSAAASIDLQVTRER